MRILILEDHFTLQQEIVDVLAGLGHEVFGVKNATEACDVLKTASFGAIVTDIFVKADGHYQPDGGLLLISRVRKQPNNFKTSPDVPIIVITGGMHSAAGRSTVEMACDFGADEVLAKPLDMLKLINWIQEIELIYSN